MPVIQQNMSFEFLIMKELVAVIKWNCCCWLAVIFYMCVVRVCAFFVCVLMAKWWISHLTSIM